MERTATALDQKKISLIIDTLAKSTQTEEESAMILDEAISVYKLDAERLCKTKGLEIIPTEVHHHISSTFYKSIARVNEALDDSGFAVYRETDVIDNLLKSEEDGIAEAKKRRALVLQAVSQAKRGPSISLFGIVQPMAQPATKKSAPPKKLVSSPHGVPVISGWK